MIITPLLLTLLLTQQPAQASPAQQAVIRAETVVLIFRDHDETITRGEAEDEYLRLLETPQPDRLRVAALVTALQVHADACLHYPCGETGGLITPFPEFRRGK